MSASTITLNRQVPVPADRAYRAWVDPQELAGWWWPQWQDTRYDLEPREGAEFRIHSAEGGVGVTGVLTTVEEARLLTMTWLWINGEDTVVQDLVDVVEVRFTDNGEGSVVTVLHTSTEHESDGGAEQGWNDVLDRLPAYLVEAR